MSGIRIFLIALGILFALFFLTGLFLPAQAHIERSIGINAPVDSVFLMVSDFNHYIRWNPFNIVDGAAEIHIYGQPGAPDHRYTWSGDTIGSGSLTITKIIPGKMIRFKLLFTAPRTFEATEIWRFEPTVQGGAQVTRINESKLNYPIGRIFGLFLDGMLGPELENGLVQLKTYCRQHFAEDRPFSDS